jgi:transcriptional regulator with XRE-family HTH domain
MTVGERLRELREEHGFSQTDVAAGTGFSSVIISNVETGRCGVKTDLLCALSEFFNVSTDYLVGATEKRSRTYVVFESPDEHDLLEGFRKMNKSQKRILLGTMEDILSRKEAANASV